MKFVFSFIVIVFLIDEVKPVDNTNIYIPRGVWLVVDYPLPRILSLRIDGVLEFEQGINDTLYVDNILINGGQLELGITMDT
ncbi:unnamed protein product, partial [Rotaria magnacalcarata]